MHCLRQIFTIKEDSLVTQLLLRQIIHSSLKKQKQKQGDIYTDTALQNRKL
jgi:hypothetical protein